MAEIVWDNSLSIGMDEIDDATASLPNTQSWQDPAHLSDFQEPEDSVNS